jgi:hypothetical protein
MMYLGRTRDSTNIELAARDLTTHGVILGRTGSGKTGLTTVLIEEAAMGGASVLVLDPKGDLTNLALRLPSQEEFSVWGSEEEYQRFIRGLAASGYDAQSVAYWRDAAGVSIYAPGKTAGGGKALNVFPTFAVPHGHDVTTFRSHASRDVEMVLDAVGAVKDQYDPALIFITELVVLHWRGGHACPVNVWPGALSNPPRGLQTFGGMALNDFLPKRRRTDIARKLIGFQHQADRWLVGDRLDLHAMVGGEKPEVAVMSMRHLGEEDRQFFSALLLNRVVDFMYQTDASEDLKLLVVLDEARGYLPPHPHNPQTKAPIGTLLAQGRAQGIGMLVGTQSPMDLDYKALSNVGTWFVGRLRARDMQRDLFQELKDRNTSFSDIEALRQREFLLIDKHGGHNIITSRYAFSYLKGPLNTHELKRLEAAEAAQSKRGLLGGLFGMFRAG